MSTSTRPLVVRFGAFGDMILMIPVLNLLAQRYGQPCDVISSGPWTRPLLERVPAVASCRLLTSRRAPYWFNRSQREFVAYLRTQPPRPVYVFEPDEKPMSLLRRGGVKPEWICTQRNFPLKPGDHILAHALQLARETPPALRDAMSAPCDPSFAPDARPTLTSADHDDCARWLTSHGIAAAPIVLIQPGNKKTMKGGNPQRASNVDYWPEANWARVIERLAALSPAARFIICGAPSERVIAEDIVAALPRSVAKETILNGAGELPLVRLLALQARAHSMVSVNTGPAHSAAAMGCPLLVMFTRHPHRSAELYAPVPTTAAVKILQPPANEPLQIGLRSISPEDVAAGWRLLVGL